MGNLEIFKLKIFLCHASEDKEKVHKLYLRLLNEGFDPWLDEEKLLPGEDYRYKISQAVKESHIVLVCLSNKSITKTGYVQTEIKFALDKADEQPEDVIYIIPLKLEECKVPNRLINWQWLDYFKPQGHQKLITSLNKRCLELGILNNVDSKISNTLIPLLKLFKDAFKNNKILDWKDFDWISDSRRELIKFLDEKELAFALKCALQHGKNIPFWCRANSKNQYAINSIVRPIFEHYGQRPLLRSGYAMEKLTNDLRLEIFDRLTDSVNRLKSSGNDIPFRVVNAAKKHKTIEFWKKELMSDVKYSTYINQLIQEISEPDT